MKEQLINACISHLNETIEQTRKMSGEIQSQVNDYGQNKDRYDSFRTKMMRTKEMYMQQMENAAVNIKALSDIPMGKTDTVEQGSIVITDKQCFFVGVGIGKIQFQGGDYFVISMAAPIFKAMEGKKIGDNFVFNNVKHIIKELL